MRVMLLYLSGLLQATCPIAAAKVVSLHRQRNTQKLVKWPYLLLAIGQPSCTLPVIIPDYSAGYAFCRGNVWHMLVSWWLRIKRTYKNYASATLMAILQTEPKATETGYGFCGFMIPLLLYHESAQTNCSTNELLYREGRSVNRSSTIVMQVTTDSVWLSQHWLRFQFGKRRSAWWSSGKGNMGKAKKRSKDT